MELSLTFPIWNGLNSKFKQKINCNRKWQKPLELYLRKQLDLDIPVLGICYGHQLMAASFGCKVDLISKDHKIIKEVRKITFTPHADIKFLSNEYAYSHAQIVKEISSEFDVIGFSNKFQFECIKHKTLPYIGIQAHPEASKSFLLKDCLVPQNSISKIQANGHHLINHFIKYAQSTCEKSNS